MKSQFATTESQYGVPPDPPRNRTTGLPRELTGKVQANDPSLSVHESVKLSSLWCTIRRGYASPTQNVTTTELAGPVPSTYAPVTSTSVICQVWPAGTQKSSAPIASYELMAEEKLSETTPRPKLLFWLYNTTVCLGGHRARVSAPIVWAEHKIRAVAAVRKADIFIEASHCRGGIVPGEGALWQIGAQPSCRASSPSLYALEMRRIRVRCMRIRRHRVRASAFALRGRLGRVPERQPEESDQEVAGAPDEGEGERNGRRQTHDAADKNVHAFLNADAGRDHEGEYPERGADAVDDQRAARRDVYAHQPEGDPGLDRADRPSSEMQRHVGGERATGQIDLVEVALEIPGGA